MTAALLASSARADGRRTHVNASNNQPQHKNGDTNGDRMFTAVILPAFDPAAKFLVPRGRSLSAKRDKVPFPKGRIGTILKVYPHVGI